MILAKDGQDGQDGEDAGKGGKREGVTDTWWRSKSNLSPHI